MRKGTLCFPFGITIIVALSHTSLAAQETESWEWQRATPSTGEYSVELPCSPAQVAEFSENLPPAFNEGLPYTEGSVVSCQMDGWVIIIGVVNAPEDLSEQLGFQSFFDVATDQIRMHPSDPSITDQAVRKTCVSGHWAVFFDGKRDNGIHQDGIIEYGDRAYISFGVAAHAGFGADLTFAPAMIDHFVNSFEVSE